MKMGYYQQNEFSIDLINSRKPRKYAGYVTSIRNNCLQKLGCSCLIDDIQSIIVDKTYSVRLIKDLQYLNVFLSDLTKLASMGNGKAVNLVKSFNTTIGSVQSWNTGLSEYINYLSGKVNGIQRKCNQYKIMPWNSAINKLTDCISDIYASNGIESLLCKFNNEDEFVKEVINNSYFFTDQLANNRFLSICNEWKNKGSLPARKSTDKNIQNNGRYYYIDNNNVRSSIRVSIDPNGNKAVVDLIENETGYRVSSGKQSIFQNYIISHLWGDAFDPRNFTSFWNLAIVPAWGNFLLDKIDSNDELTLKAINTFKAIAIKIYKMSGLCWSDIDKDYKQLRPNPKYVIKGSYAPKIIAGKNSQQNYGNIKNKRIVLQ